jgi:hypothetical protein
MAHTDVILYCAITAKIDPIKKGVQTYCTTQLGKENDRDLDTTEPDLSTLLCICSLAVCSHLAGKKCVFLRGYHQSLEQSVGVKTMIYHFVERSLISWISVFCIR